MWRGPLCSRNGLGRCADPEQRGQTKEAPVWLGVKVERQATATSRDILEPGPGRRAYGYNRSVDCGHNRMGGIVYPGMNHTKATEREVSLEQDARKRTVSTAATKRVCAHLSMAPRESQQQCPWSTSSVGGAKSYDL